MIDKPSYNFDVVWSDANQSWIVRPSSLRWVGDQVIVFGHSSKECQEIAAEANLHRYRGSVRYGGYIPPHQDEIEAICQKAGQDNPSRKTDIRRAILTACQSFGSANSGQAPMLRVVEALAYQVLPGFDHVLDALKKMEEQQEVCPSYFTPELWKLRIKMSEEDGSLARIRKDYADRYLEEICQKAGTVPPDRWWMQDMFLAYQNLPISQ